MTMAVTPENKAAASASRSTRMAGATLVALAVAGVGVGRARLASLFRRTGRGTMHNRTLLSS
jgi:hypothetical protein